MPLDRRLRDEFQRTAATAPTTVAPDTLTAVADRVGQIRRNRRTATAVAALAVVVVAALVALPDEGQAAHSVLPATSPTPSPSRTPLDRTFTSSVHRYTMAYPDNWTAVPARTTSEPDTFRAPGGAVVTVSTEQLAAGQTEDQWVADYLPGAGGSRRRDCFPPRDRWLPVDVGGHQGGLLGGDFGCDLTEAVVFVDRRVYIVDAVPELPTGLFDQGLLSQLLSSVSFLPPSGQ